MKDTTRLQHILRARCAPLPLLAVLAVPPTLAEGLRDPMRPPMASTAAPDRAPARALRLEAILVEGERRVAIVDGKVVSEGERVSGAVISAIHADSIQYTRDGRTHEARLRRAEELAAMKRRSSEDGT